MLSKIVISLLLFPCLANADEVVTNWTKGQVEVKATGYALADKVEAEALAEDAARTEAYGLLLQSVKGINVTTEKTLDQFGKEHTTVETRMEGFVSNVISQTQPKFKKLGNKIEATIEVKMCLHNAGASECAGRESVLSLVNEVTPLPPKVVAKEILKNETPCEDVLPTEFNERPWKGITSVAISAENYKAVLKPDILTVKYPNGKGGFCTLFSYAKMDVPSVDAYRSGSRFKYIHKTFKEAQLDLMPQVIEIKAIAVEKDNVIIVDPQDGKYIYFIDENMNRELSLKGRVSVITSSAVTHENK